METSGWMDVLKPLQKALYKAPEQFDEVRDLVGQALRAAKEMAKKEIDSIQMGVDLGETLTNSKLVDVLNRVLNTKGPCCDAPFTHGPMCECVRSEVYRMLGK